MAALDLFGRRWALRILWELRREPVGARALADRCGGISTSVLYERLRELSDAGLVTQGPDGRYALTDIGVALASAIAPLDEWAERWAESSTTSLQSRSGERDG